MIFIRPLTRKQVRVCFSCEFLFVMKEVCRRYNDQCQKGGLRMVRKEEYVTSEKETEMRRELC